MVTVGFDATRNASAAEKYGNYRLTWLAFGFASYFLEFSHEVLKVDESCLGKARIPAIITYFALGIIGAICTMVGTFLCFKYCSNSCWEDDEERPPRPVRRRPIDRAI